MRKPKHLVRRHWLLGFFSHRGVLLSLSLALLLVSSQFLPHGHSHPAMAQGSNFGLTFDGVNDVVSAALVPGTGPLTMEAWIRPAANNSNGLALVGSDDVNGWSLELNNGRLTLWLSTTVGWFSNQHPTNLLAGQWYHIAATYENGSARTYVNGVAANPTSTLGTLTQGSLFSAGGLVGSFYPYLAGDIDEVRISNAIRYDGGFTVPQAPFSPDANTLLLWHFDEGSGQVVGDVSANANNGTLGITSGAENRDPAWDAGYPFPAAGPTSTPTPMPTNTPTNTPGPTATPTNPPTNTPTPLPTNTPGPTATPSGNLFSQTSTTDFGLGLGCSTLNSTLVTNINGGEVRLAAFVEDYFDGPGVDTNRWFIQRYNGTSNDPVQSNGILTLSSQGIVSNLTDSQQTMEVEGRIQFWPPTGNGVSDFGLSDPFQVAFGFNALFIIDSDGRLYANNLRNTQGLPRQRTEITGVDPTLYHDYRISISPAQVDFYIDGNLVATHTQPTPLVVGPMGLWMVQADPVNDLNVEWARWNQYPISGTFVSCPIDAGQSGPWSTFSWNGDTPAGTGVNIETRTSDDGLTWSAWSASNSAASFTITSPAGRYLQYRLTLNTSNALRSPQVDDVTVSFNVGTPTPTPTPTETPTPTNTPLPTFTPTATNTPLPTPTPTNTPPPTATPAATPTNTPVPPPTATPVPTSTPTFTPTPTATPIPTATPTSPPTATPIGGASVTHTSLIDFGSCGPNTGVSVTNVDGGEIRLAALIEDYFDGSSIDPTRWVTGTVNSGYGALPRLENGILIADSSWISSTVSINSQDLPLAVEGRVRFSEPGRGTGWADVGLAKVSEIPGPPNALFITDNSGNTYGNDFQPGDSDPQRTVITGFDWNQFHDIRMVMDTNQVEYYVDGTLQVTHSLATPMPMPMYLWFYTLFIDYDFATDWLRLARYPANGEFTACVVDMGSLYYWNTLTWQGALPAAATVSFETRSSGDAVTWSAWQPLGAGDQIVSPAGRFLQYRATLTTVDLTLSPQIEAVIVTGQQVPPTPTPSPTNTPTATNTPLPTATPTPLPTNTPTPLPTPTNTPAPPPTATNTPLPPPTATPTSTPLPTNTPTPAPTATNTPLPPPTATPTNTPTATSTPLPTDTPTATPIPTPTPDVSSGLNFDGGDDVVRAAQIPGTGPLTIEMWVRPNQNFANQIIMAQADGNTGWSLELNGGYLTFWLATNRGWESEQMVLARLQANQWYHVVATYDNGLARTFVNGAASPGTATGALTQASSLYLGGFPGYGYFNGLVDEVRVSDVVRYNGPYTVPNAPFANDGNTLLLWSMDSGSGQVVFDESASGNNGTLGETNQAETSDPTWVLGYSFP